MKRDKTIGFKHHSKKGKGSLESHYLRITFDRVSTNLLIDINSPTEKYINDFKSKLTQVIRYFEKADNNFSIQGIKEKYDICFQNADDHFKWEATDELQNNVGDILTYNQHTKTFHDTFYHPEEVENYESYKHLQYARERFMKNIFKKVSTKSRYILLLEISIVHYSKIKDLVVLDFLTNREILNNFMKFTESNIEKFNKEFILEIKPNENKISDIKEVFMDIFYRTDEYSLPPQF